MTKGLARDCRGVSDVLAIAFMFLMAIFSGTMLHSYRFDAVNSAVNRQLSMKAEYLYRTLELAQVENYSMTYFEAIAENLMQVSEPVVPGDYLRERIDNLLAYYSSDNAVIPSGYAVMIKLTRENLSWEQFYPNNASEPSPYATRFQFSGKLTMIIAGAENGMVQVDAMVALFKQEVSV
jgi:hypothetical protein